MRALLEMTRGRPGNATGRPGVGSRRGLRGGLAHKKTTSFQAVERISAVWGWTPDRGRCYLKRVFRRTLPRVLTPPRRSRSASFGLVRSRPDGPSGPGPRFVRGGSRGAFPKNCGCSGQMSVSVMVVSEVGEQPLSAVFSSLRNTSSGSLPLARDARRPDRDRSLAGSETLHLIIPTMWKSCGKLGVSGQGRRDCSGISGS